MPFGLEVSGTFNSASNKGIISLVGISSGGGVTGLAYSISSY